MKWFFFLDREQVAESFIIIHTPTAIIQSLGPSVKILMHYIKREGGILYMKALSSFFPF